ncbi:hypothetical protein KVH24_23090 [Streptomyces olivaceus]|uniref:hypothetical protein n=1 Tax=Streptomyces olivaceus TaxID=47716 RepID=UPI001CCE2D25|nr:hypothetical protein [Streptomyces olivaceus]MBZ6175601.1 hypothetical protein [Streptomyces olivaceus]MBZ6181857.1 hypothetical protein [Streptomyces olivaceus]
MIISFTRDDGTVEEVTTNELSAREAAAIEHAMGGTQWQRVEGLLRLQDPTALLAVLWAFRKREQPDLKFDDFDVPNWKRRLKAGTERSEIEDLFDNVIVQALGKSEDAQIDLMVPALKKGAHNPADVDDALEAVGKGHLVKHRTTLTD